MIMRITRVVAAILGGLGVSAGFPSQSVSQTALQSELMCEDVRDIAFSELSFAEYQRAADCACDAALEDGSLEALEEFLDKWGGASTACRAKALELLRVYEPDQNVDVRPEGGPNFYGG
jgi:hypothetical protein